MISGQRGWYERNFHLYKRLCNPPLSTPWPCEGVWSYWGLHLVSPSALFDTPHSVCKQTSFDGDLCEDDPCCQCYQYSAWAPFWCYQGLAEPYSRSTCWRWSSVQHSGQSHSVTLWRRWRWLPWLLLLVLRLLLLFHNFLSGWYANAERVLQSCPIHDSFQTSFPSCRTCTRSQ